MENVLVDHCDISGLVSGHIVEKDLHKTEVGAGDFGGGEAGKSV